MEEAIALAVKSVASGGGPFGAVVVREGSVIARAHNVVTPNCDPTAHAEIEVLRTAGRALGTHDLSGCVLYTSCEPCPMCLAACYWAHIDAVYFAATCNQAAEAGFSDAHIYAEIPRPVEERDLPMHRCGADQAATPFVAWAAHEGRVDY
jgi:tRNA(Arg) A34 adenosine deaminase TadA